MASSSLMWLLVALLLGLAIGTGFGWTLASARHAQTHSSGRDTAAQAHAEAAQWRARAEELAARTAVAEERADRDASVLRALAPLRTQLDQVATRVEEMERERASQHASLSEQLRAGAVAERELLRTTQSLSSALRSRSSRGLWGEVELARVLEASGMLPHVDFSEQRSVGGVLSRRAGGSRGGAARAAADSSRPDVIIHLPGEGFLAVDAKAPMDAYLRAAALEEGSAEAERRAALAEHAKALRGHVEQLAARRYDRALGSSPEFVALFLPAESMLSAALEADPALLEDALARGVSLVTPASLLALLRVCATAWARAAVHDDAQELLELGRTLYERLGTVAGHLDALGSSLGRSVAAYNKAVASMESRLLVTARSFESLSAQVPSPRAINPDEAQVRSFSTPELSQSEGRG